MQKLKQNLEYLNMIPYETQMSILKEEMGWVQKNYLQLAVDSLTRIGLDMAVVKENRVGIQKMIDALLGRGIRSDTANLDEFGVWVSDVGAYFGIGGSSGVMGNHLNIHLDVEVVNSKGDKDKFRKLIRDMLLHETSHLLQPKMISQLKESIYCHEFDIGAYQEACAEAISNIMQYPEAAQLSYNPNLVILSYNMFEDMENEELKQSFVLFNFLGRIYENEKYMELNKATELAGGAINLISDGEHDPRQTRLEYAIELLDDDYLSQAALEFLSRSTSIKIPNIKSALGNKLKKEFIRFSLPPNRMEWGESLSEDSAGRYFEELKQVPKKTNED